MWKNTLDIISVVVPEFFGNSFNFTKDILKSTSIVVRTKMDKLVAKKKNLKHNWNQTATFVWDNFQWVVDVSEVNFSTL